MTRLSTTRHPRGRRIIGRTLLAATLLTAVAAVPAAAAVAPQRTTAAAARDDVSEAEAQQVSHFYASYLDAVAAEDGGNLATALRGFYLTPELRQELRAWEKTNHADGVLRAQDVPAAFRVTAGDSGSRPRLDARPAHLGFGRPPHVHEPDRAVGAGHREDLRHPRIAPDGPGRPPGGPRRRPRLRPRRARPPL